MPLNLFGIAGYKLVRVIAEGAFSEVYEATEEDREARFAIKVLKLVHQHNETERKRILKESKIGLSIPKHKHLTQFLACGESTGRPFIVMEYAQGRSLREILHEKGKLNEPDLFFIAEGVGSALAHLHAAKVFHRDVKPDNVILQSREELKLVDLGFANTHRQEAWNFLGRTLDGSPAYLAPELIRSKRATVGSELYALGCLLYECATGIPPFPAKTAQEIMARHVDPKDRPPRATVRNPNINPLTERLIHQCLEKDPAQRFPSAEEFLNSLSHAKRAVAIAGGRRRSTQVLRKDSQSSHPGKR